MLAPDSDSRCTTPASNGEREKKKVQSSKCLLGAADKNGFAEFRVNVFSVTTSGRWEELPRTWERFQTSTRCQLWVDAAWESTECISKVVDHPYVGVV